MLKRSILYLGVLILLTVFVFACAPKKAAAPRKPTEPSLEVKVAPKPQKVLVVADFDTGSKPNNIGGDFGSWSKDPNDPSQGCQDSFTSEEKYGKEGYAIKLKYDVDSPNPAYNGFWMKLENIDVSTYDKLVFYIKGNTEAGYPQKIKVELKNNRGETGKTYVSQISGTWAPVEIPLSSFKGIKDFSVMTEFNIVFEDTVTKPKTGIIYIDNVQFAKD